MDKLDIPTLRQMQLYVKRIKGRRKTPTPGGRKTPGGKKTPGTGTGKRGGKTTPSPLRRPSSQRKNDASPDMSMMDMGNFGSTSPSALDQALMGQMSEPGGLDHHPNPPKPSKKPDSDSDSSSSSGSDSDSDSDAKKAPVRKPPASDSSSFGSAPPTFGDPSGMYSVETSTHHAPSPSQTTQSKPKAKEVVTVNSTAWGSLESAEPEKEENNEDHLWSSFQSQQQQQTQLERERDERESRLRESREREALQLKQQAEDAKRRQMEEAEIANRQQLQAEEEEERRLEEERERARQMRQQAAVVDLGEQRTLMDEIMNTFG